MTVSGIGARRRTARRQAARQLNERRLRMCGQDAPRGGAGRIPGSATSMTQRMRARAAWHTNSARQLVLPSWVGRTRLQWRRRGLQQRRRRRLECGAVLVWWLYSSAGRWGLDWTRCWEQRRRPRPKGHLICMHGPGGLHKKGAASADDDGGLWGGAHAGAGARVDEKRKRTPPERRSQKR